MAGLHLLQPRVRPRARPRAHRSPPLVPPVAALLYTANAAAPVGAVLRAVHQAPANIRTRTTLSAWPAEYCFANLGWVMSEWNELDAK